MPVTSNHDLEEKPTNTSSRKLENPVPFVMPIPGDYEILLGCRFQESQNQAATLAEPQFVQTSTKSG